MRSIQGGVPLSRVNKNSDDDDDEDDDDDDDDDDDGDDDDDDDDDDDGPTFSSFNPCPSLSFVATDNTKQFQSLNIVLKKNLDP